MYRNISHCKGQTEGKDHYWSQNMKCIDKEDAVETFYRGFERLFTVLISSKSIFHLPTNEAELASLVLSHGRRNTNAKALEIMTCSFSPS